LIVSIASGKGGTGKTLVATSLALSLQEKHRVCLLDCDVEEPDDYIFMKPNIIDRESVSIPVPLVDEKKCSFCGKCAAACAYKAIAVWGKKIMVFSELCHGCGACSYLCPEKAIKESPQEIGTVEWGNAGNIDFVQGKLDIGEAMSPPVIRQVKSHINREAVNILDAPPGTSCPVITTVKDSDFCLLVTDPTPFGLNDLKLAVETVKQLQIPCGVVINRWVNGQNETENYCREQGIPVLLAIPLDTGIARSYSRGMTLVEAQPGWKDEFSRLYLKIQEAVDERSRCSER